MLCHCCVCVREWLLLCHMLMNVYVNGRKLTFVIKHLCSWTLCKTGGNVDLPLALDESAAVAAVGLNTT